MSTSKMIPMSAIIADEEFNCRGKIPAHSVQDLANDLNDRGLMQAITVAPMPDGKYKLIAGFRRFSAASILGWTEIEAKVDGRLVDDKLAAITNIVENVQRSELNIVQEATALGRLFKFGMTESEVMNMTNMNRGWVQLRKMVWRLPDDIYPAIIDGIITQTNIRELYTLFTTQPIEAFYENVRWIKDQRALGRRAVSIDGRIKEEVARKGPKIRSIGEITMMQATVQRATGEYEHIIAKVLGWCAGRVSGEEFTAALEQYYTENLYK